ncbi:putative methyltransferase-domain-containing protein [Hypoxylon sp. NC0597]|nr:putative methyltransferase-domain-containing protein [Hypoxylon sp. NC0597]
MLDRDVDPQLLLLRRQYMQLFEPDFLAWPPPKFLKGKDVQKWLYRYMFDQSRNPRLPPEGYQMHVLKQLISKIEKVAGNPEDEVSNELRECYTSFMTREVPSEFQAAQEKAYVTFTCIAEKTLDGADNDNYDDGLEPTISLLEQRHLVSGSRTTGFRTWEGSLHLGSYLLTGAGSRLVRGKNILELGAGTGFLTILSAKHLNAKHVTTTDGDEKVIKALRENLALNEVDDQQRVRAETLMWGRNLKETWVEDDCAAHPYDVVLGADITYDKVAITALVSTLNGLFDFRPTLKVIISGVIRNPETFQTFRDECASRRFAVKDIEFEPKPMRQQKALFYATAMPIKILSITRP